MILISPNSQQKFTRILEEKAINHQVFYPETEKTHLMARQLESVTYTVLLLSGKTR